MLKRLVLFAAFIFCVVLLNSSLAFTYSSTPFDEETIVRQKCTACHKITDKNKIDVISETRRSPEEWEDTIWRMKRLNDAPIEEEKIDKVVKELSMYLGLSPKEMSKVSYYNYDGNSHFRERQHFMKNKEDKRIFRACVRCHAYGKIASHRKTEEVWEATRDMHLGYYPTTIPQMREIKWVPETNELIGVLADRFPFKTKSWENWKKNRKIPNLSGEWSIFGYQPGVGFYHGTYTFNKIPEVQDEYNIKKKIEFQDGMTVVTEGKGTLYSGYHLRYKLSPSQFLPRVEGVFNLKFEEMGFRGSWWTTIQDTNAHGNERFYKTNESSNVFGVYPVALKINPNKLQVLKLYGVNLPDDIKPTDIQFSRPGISVKEVVTSEDTHVICRVEVNNQASIGKLTPTVQGIKSKQKVTLYDEIEGIRINPNLGRARVSCGKAYPPQGVQFEARAIHFGKDGKRGTNDDLLLNPVYPKWSLEEEKTRENDKDLKYLKAPLNNGLYTPKTTYAPIKGRMQNKEGTGLIAVKAKYSH
jgi:quinohemoprotein amine dehydrogenase